MAPRTTTPAAATLPVPDAPRAAAYEQRPSNALDEGDTVVLAAR